MAHIVARISRRRRLPKRDLSYSSNVNDRCAELASRSLVTFLDDFAVHQVPILLAEKCEKAVDEINWKGLFIRILYVGPVEEVPVGVRRQTA